MGLDVFALGEHHNPPFVSSSPTTLFGHIAALTEPIILSTSVTLMTTNDPVKIAEDYAMLQHVARGRLDLMVGRGNTAPVYPWFGKDISQGVALALENFRCTSTGHGLFDTAHVMQVRATGLAASRASPMGSPQPSHVPYVPASNRFTAASISAR